MTLSANVNWRVDTGGAETNGGGFDPSLTTNMLTDGAATSATGTAPVFSSASYNFAAIDVGACVYIAAGTNWTPGWYPIVSVASNVATLDAAITSNRGGALRADYTPLLVSGCATTASPTGATWSIDYAARGTAISLDGNLTSTASTTATSSGAAWHKGMIGNILRISAGTGATTGYYAITNVASTTSLTLDRVSGTYTAGVFRIGGPHASLVNYSTGTSGLGTPAIATPLVAGTAARIWIKGAGSESPSVVDYDYSAGYWTFPAGSSAGRFIWFGYNGKPLIAHEGLLAYGGGTNPMYMTVIYCAFKQTSSTGNGYGIFSITNGITAVTANNLAYSCIFDQNGNDAIQWRQSAVDCYFKNTGSTTNGTAPAHSPSCFGCRVQGNVYENIRGSAIEDDIGLSFISNNIIRNCKGNNVEGGIRCIYTYYMSFIIGNTIDGGAAHGINIVAPTSLDAKAGSFIINNIISNHAGSGKNGINCAAETTAANDLAKYLSWDYNNLYGNTGAYGSCSAGLHDIALDPQFTNTGASDYSVGTNMKAIGFPRTFPA